MNLFKQLGMSQEEIEKFEFIQDYIKKQKDVPRIARSHVFRIMLNKSYAQIREALNKINN